MDIRVLKYFLAVVREETIVGAAQVLHVTQPTLSRQMMDLEEELGKQLFIRGKRKISLTEDGMFLRSRAQEIVDLAEKTEADFHAQEDMVKGEICIGVGETNAFSLVSRTIKLMRETYPLIKFHLFNGNAETITAKLDKGLLDFGIVEEPLESSKYGSLKLPTYDTWGLLLKKTHPLASKSGITPKDLDDIPLLCSELMSEDNRLTKWFGNHNIKLNIVCTYNLVYNAIIMVQEDVGCALIQSRLVNTTGSDLCFIPITPSISASANMVWKKYQVCCKACDKFLDILKQEIKNDK